MLIVVSPAKALDLERPLSVAMQALSPTTPRFLPQAAALVEVLAPMAPPTLATLMGLSDALAQLNAARFGAWDVCHDADTSRPALATFNGDVYDGLDSGSLPTPALAWLQTHLRILSGLYGVLRPLDWMQAYRLEMGTALANPAGKDLYALWRPQVAQALRADLQAAGGEPVLINLASQEYFKAVDKVALKARVIDCVFEDFKGGQYKIISFYAKRARGLMARFAATRALSRPDQLTDFDLEGYAYAPAQSSPDRLVFRRRVVT